MVRIVEKEETNMQAVRAAWSDQEVYSKVGKHIREQVGGLKG